MKKKLLISAGLAVILLAAFFGLSQKWTFAPAKKISFEIKQTSGPTVPIPARPDHALTAMILETLNVSLTQTQETSADEQPRRWSPAYIQLKKSFRSLIEAKLANPNPPWKTLTECQAQIQKELKDSLEEASRIFQSALGDNETEKFYNPLDPDSLKFSEVPGHSDLAVVTVTGQVVCGSDTSIYIFRKKEKGYQLVLAQNDEDPDSTGFGGSDYGISPSDEKGDFFIVLPHGFPWCTSCWGSMDRKILRIGADADHPKILDEKSEFYYRCGGWTLNVGKNDYTMTFTGGQSLDSGVLFRKCLRHFRVDGDKVRVVGPLGDFPEDFLDEWIKISWDQAEPFCRGKDKAGLKKWHENLQQSKGSTSFLFIQPCPKDPARWEIGIETDDKSMPSKIYFEIFKKDGDFFLEDIRKDRSGNCPGEKGPEAHPVEMG